MSDPHTVPTLAQPYAICLDCDAQHEDSAAMRAHHAETLPADRLGSSHRGRVVNPTPEEQVANRARFVVGRAIEDAQEAAFEDIDREIRRGDVTEEAVAEALRWYSDFADAWDDWCKGGDR